jgi:ubiquinone/menaquinone biosynthesis C-methylase UbiE
MVVSPLVVSSTVIDTSPELFDGQADAFDRRVGLQPGHCRQIAAAVLELGGGEAADLVVEAGAGTGEIGIWLAAQRRYVGFDLSSGMLRRFRDRLAGSTAGCLLVRADANRGWPLAAGEASVIFSSRAIHLFDPDHVANEVFRGAQPSGATLVMGRVERPPESLRARLAEEMRRRLRRAGIDGRGDRQRRRLVELCLERGAELVEPVTAAEWTASVTPRRSLQAWRELRGLAGVEVPDDVRRAVLDDVERWASEEFGGLDQAVDSPEAYVLTPLRLRGR